MTAYQSSNLAPGPSGRDGLGTIASIASDELEDRRIKLFRLQKAARKLMYDKSLPSDKQERVCSCLRWIAPFQDAVTINRRPTGQTNYSGLQVCGSVWMCPVCAAKITEGRRKQLSTGLQRWINRGGLVSMATYTLQHKRSDKLPNVLDALIDSYRGMKSGRRFQTLKTVYGWVGSVRSLEVTYGDNGWHCHIHELIFHDPHPFACGAADFGLLKDNLSTLWKHQLNLRGFDASWERGVDVTEGDQAAGHYIDKWGLEHELTKSPAKNAANTGKTPLQLLSGYAEGDKRSGALWREYALCFKGRNQLVWSRGLRALLELPSEEETDQTLADQLVEQASDAQVMAELTREQWRAVVVAEKRGEVLAIAAHGDLNELWDYLVSIGVPIVFRQNLTDIMWSEYERQHGNRTGKQNER